MVSKMVLFLGMELVVASAVGKRVVEVLRVISRVMGLMMMMMMMTLAATVSGLVTVGSESVFSFMLVVVVFLMPMRLWAFQTPYVSAAPCPGRNTQSG